MFNVYSFNTINEDVAFVIGVILNITLITFIFTTKAKELNRYNRILLQTCFVDFFFLLVTFLVKPVKIVDCGYEYLIANGLARHLPFPYRFYAFDVWMFALSLSISSVPTEFIYQYWIIVHNKDFSLKKQLFCFGIAVFASIVFAIACYYIYYERTSHLLYLGNNIANIMSDEDGVVWTVGMVLPIGQDNRIIYGIILIILIAIGSYVIIAFCNIRTYMHLQGQKSLSSKTLEVQKQMGKILTLQAFVPLISAAFPSSLLIMALIFTNLSIAHITVFVTTLFSWVAPGNAFFILFVLKPYRRRMILFVKRILCCARLQTVGFLNVSARKSNSGTPAQPS
uniref:G_PROTEIN_RECEP_F1_2 domain-containing protein n=1 Tax=Panagrellus redivivus TaxID=6233 RepID=A0A7E4UMU7_PANRE